MNIGFYKVRLNERGDTVAMFDYADYNEKLLGNKSFIIAKTDVEHKGLDKFEKRFGKVYFIDKDDDIEDVIKSLNITHLYYPKFGTKEGITKVSCKLLVHCVFTSQFPHGDRCAVVGQTINDIYKTKLPVLHHIVTLPNHEDTMRDELGIPSCATVFGRYGGYDSFNIPVVYEVIKHVVNNFTNIYFAFMNTEKFYEHPQIKYVEGTTDMYIKRKFINSTDALILAKDRGETFGLTCGEFAICEKTIIASYPAFEMEHFNILGDQIIGYRNPRELFYILTHFKPIYMKNNGYMSCDPISIMNIFKSVFLDPPKSLE